MKNLVYIGYQPLTQKVMEDFFIKDFILDGYNVQYWDLSEIYFPEVNFLNAINENWIVKVCEISQLKRLLDNEDEECFYFINFPYEWFVIKVFKLLTKYDVKTGIIARGMLPLPSFSYDLSLTNFLLKLNFKKIVKFTQNKISFLLKKNGFIKPFDLVFYTGNESLKILGTGFQTDIKSANLIPINSSDYEKYLKTKSTIPEFVGKYVVFLDEYLPFHPDWEMFKIETLEASKYYESLNNFFAEVEEKYGLKVIIAAHPKADKYNKENFFKGREVYFGKTVELVKNSEFVIAHMSTAVGFAATFEKKMIFIYTYDLYRIMRSQYNIIKYFSEIFNTQLINIDSFVVSEIDTKIDKKRYNNFIFSYMTSVENRDIDSYSLVKRNF
ncbi:hypothetical protein ACQKCJ_08335 [Flavobacterium sp. NPDC079362]|uniref:hypothetical protein n=1 Tax=Flavobacterium sp. NPDC079362 TaxID=3390566 RepID=UPI003CFF1BA1